MLQGCISDLVNSRNCVRLTGTEYNWTQKYTSGVWNIVYKSGALDMVMVWIFEVTSDFDKEVMQMAAVMLCERFAVTYKKGRAL